MLAVALGLLSGLVWGVGDFAAGVASRRALPLGVVVVEQAWGWALALAGLALLRPPVPAGSDLLVGAAAGVCGGLGLIAFYRAMSVGSIAPVAPVSAIGALVPVTLDLAAGRDPGGLALAGMAVALAGAALAARAPGPATRRGLGLALVAALGFGGFFVLLAQASDGAGALWAFAASRTASVPLTLVILVVVARGRPGIPRTVLPLVLVAGTFDAAANLLFALGTQQGLVSVVAVLGSLYPVATVALAGVLLSERLGRLQAAGAGVALLGVALIAGG
jgi:drug/metabolite transporter (DMT)-like permease